MASRPQDLSRYRNLAAKRLAGAADSRSKRYVHVIGQSWLSGQVASLGTASGHGPWPVDAEDAAEIRGLTGTVVATARQFGASRCASAADCHQLTRDVRDTVQLMIATLRNPGLLDTGWVSPWMTPAS